MTHETMTVHQALAELKILDSRIDKAINGGTYLAVKRHCDKKISGVDTKEFCDTVIKASFDSATSLMSRRNAIKRAVVKSNAITVIEVAGATYTVAEAIEMNNHGVAFEQLLLDRIRNAYTIAVSEVNRNSGAVPRTISMACMEARIKSMRMLQRPRCRRTLTPIPMSWLILWMSSESCRIWMTILQPSQQKSIRRCP